MTHFCSISDIYQKILWFPYKYEHILRKSYKSKVVQNQIPYNSLYPKFFMTKIDENRLLSNFQGNRLKKLASFFLCKVQTWTLFQWIDEVWPFWILLTLNEVFSVSCSWEFDGGHKTDVEKMCATDSASMVSFWLLNPCQKAKPH